MTKIMNDRVKRYLKELNRNPSNKAMVEALKKELESLDEFFELKVL